MLDPIYITKAEYINDYKVRLYFNDGFVAVTDFKKFLTGELYKHLQDQSLFQNFQLDDWTLTWPGNSDFSPEFLYEQAKHQANQTANSSVL